MREFSKIYSRIVTNKNKGHKGIVEKSSKSISQVTKMMENMKMENLH